MDQRVEAPIRLRTDRHPLLGFCASTDDSVDALAREHEPDRTAGEPRRRGRQDLMAPERLAAEAAAHVRSRCVDLLLLYLKDLCERPGDVRHALRAVVDDQIVA